jgi:hypothetical protein
MSVTASKPSDAAGDGETRRAVAYAARVGHEMERERARRDARRMLDAEERGRIEAPDIVTLGELLAQPEEPVIWRIEGWQPHRSRVILSAPFKGSKTTTRDNLTRSLVDGDPWLGVYPVRKVSGAVAILDTEMSRSQLRRWLRDQHIQNVDRVIVIPMRGQALSLNLLDADVRSQWATWLRERNVDYLILDCLRPVIDALGLDEHRDAGRILVAFDALLDDADIPEACIVHHMGHTGERSRGDSRLRDWPDVEWRIVRQDEKPSSARYITAYGRDVDIPESQLAYDPTTRHLTIIGGTRQEATIDQTLSDVLAVLDGKPLSGRGIISAMRERGATHRDEAIREAVSKGIQRRLVVTSLGRRRAILHSLAPSASECVPSASGTDRVSESRCSYTGLTHTHSEKQSACSDSGTHSLLANSPIGGKDDERL